MNSIIEIVEANVFAHTVAEELRFLIEEALRTEERCTIALAGGMTPASVYRKLSLPPFIGTVPWSKVDLFLGDERWVDHDDSQSNYKMVKETLLIKLTESQPNVYPIDTSLNSPEKAAIEYESVIRKATQVPAPKIPALDICILGIGQDGHTASLFPSTPALRVEDKLCAAVSTDEAVKERITITFPLITEAKRVIFLVTGDSKAEILKKILESDADEFTYPAAIYKKAKGKVTWFVDGAAGNKLTR